jgi:hypothetical protein
MLPAREARSTFSITPAPLSGRQPASFGHLNGPASRLAPLSLVQTLDCTRVIKSDCKGSGLYSTPQPATRPCCVSLDRGRWNANSPIVGVRGIIPSCRAVTSHPKGGGGPVYLGKGTQSLRSARGLAPSSVIAPVSRIDVRVNALTRQPRCISETDPQ